MSENERFIFTANLKYQTTLDSVICRGVPSLTQFVSNPELEACMNVWQFFEQIHSYSYTYIIKNVYADPSSVLDSALTDKEIMKRAEVAIREYDGLNALSEKTDLRSKKKQIYLTLSACTYLRLLDLRLIYLCLRFC